MRPRRSAATLAALAVLVIALCLGGCAPGDTEVVTSRPVPPIDLEVPDQLETATFALG